MLSNIHNSRGESYLFVEMQSIRFPNWLPNTDKQRSFINDIYQSKN